MQEQDRRRSNARSAGDRLVASHGKEDPFAAAFMATRMPMIITDPNQDDNPIIFCNVAFQKLTGYSMDEVVGRNCRFLQELILIAAPFRASERGSKLEERSL